MLCNTFLSKTEEMGSVVTAGYMQSLQSEESNTITASVPAQPAQKYVQQSVQQKCSLSPLLLRVVTEASFRLIFMLIAFLQCAL